MDEPHRGAKASDRNIRAIAQIEASVHDSRSRADRLAVAITKAAGSGLSVGLHAVWFAIWLFVNTPRVSGMNPFDPFPFAVLTTVVSIEVVFLSLVVLLNQNRAAMEADKRAHLNLQINLLVEREVTLILRMQREVLHHAGVTSGMSHELEELLKDDSSPEVEP